MRNLAVPACGRVTLPSIVAGASPWHVTEAAQVQQSALFADKRENLGYPSSGGFGVSLS